ncbi:MAG TPA: hypothetical protein VH373_16075 [Jatrophihabitantaceae bacterium]|jgi:hypothetical protein
MSDGETVQPEALRQLAEQLESQLHPLLERAAHSFEAAEIEGEKFSTAGIAMQIAYPGTREFAATDADSKIEVVSAMKEKLSATAEEWDKAEHASTVKPSIVEA